MQKAEFDLIAKKFLENCVCVSVGADLSFWRFHKDLVLVRDTSSKSRDKRYRIIDEKTCNEEYNIYF